MSMMRSKLGSKFTNSALSAARMTAASNELTHNWLSKIGQTAKTSESKDLHS